MQLRETDRKILIRDMKDRIEVSSTLNSRRRENREAAVFEEIMAEIFFRS